MVRILQVLCLVAVHAFIGSVFGAEANPRAAVPSADVQAEVTRRLEEIFDFDAAKTPEAKLELAKELQALSKDAAEKPAEQFVLLRKVAELAHGGGDAGLMVAAVDAIGNRFHVDGTEARTRMLLAFARDATSTQRIESLLAVARPAFEEAMKAHRYDIAYRIVNAEHAACLRPAGQKFRKEVGQRRSRVAELKSGYEAFQKARTALAANPSDSEAALVVGRWHCFVEDEWEQGPRYLASGSDAELGAIAKQELTKPAIAAAQAKLGDAWWDLSQRSKGDDKLAMMRRAGHWYRIALPTVTGLAKLKIEKRLPEIAKVDQTEPAGGPAKSSEPKTMAPKQVVALFGLRPSDWKIEEDVLVGKIDSIDGTPIFSRPFAGKSLEFGFRIKAKWYHCLRLQIDGRSYLYSRGHWQNTGTFVVANDEKLRFRDGPRVTSPGDWHAVAVKIKDDVIAFYYDGKKQWEGKVPAGPKGKHSFQIGFDSHSTTVGIKDLILATE